ncbi:UDP-N-acetylmuramoyl-tripeptide--D-alanyl-D-alanine ligase [Ruminococcaceae bacterium FB2012]|nr:UDP-N-acetylmuramoyl-tripeptide--D-alanyl-D-alanine ligase [Ruminococcaceae bacterium FB2012]
MEKMSLSEIVSAVEGSFGYPSDMMISSISTDTRKITAGSVFIALKGDSFDGHDFAPDAMKLGAEAVITERQVEGAKCIIVDSTHKALRDLAHYYRMKFDIPLVGITGSVGKTTTKDMIACVLARKYKTLKTEGNHNNEVGMPLTLLELDNSYEAAVIEMGMNHAGEMSRLSMCSSPTLCVITNIGVSHIENLGSQENILKAKLEILDGAFPYAPLILNRDDKLLSGLELQDQRKTVWYSLKKKDADVYASNVTAEDGRISFTVNYSGGKYPAVLNVLGEHNVKNALAAFTVGVTLGIDPAECAAGVGDYRPCGLRQNIRQVKGAAFVVDCYNAAPDSMRAALNVLSQVSIADGGKRICVLADMLELGKKAAAYHKQVGEYVGSAKADMLLCFGENSKYYIEGAVRKGMPADACKHFDSREELAEHLKGCLKEGDAVLFKGSRGMKLEEVIEALE